jgi:YVTN family beta-propeller protein
MKLHIIGLLSAGICLLFLLALVPSAAVNAYSASSTWNGRVAVGAHPLDAAYDPVNKLVYVTDSGGDRLSLITSGSTPKVLSTMPKVGYEPWGITFTGSACSNVVAVANSGSSSVSLVSSASPYKTVATIHIPSVTSSAKSIPYGIAYAMGSIYVADGAGQIDIINCATHKLSVVGPLTYYSSLTSAYYDSMHKIVYFGDDGASVIWYYDLSGKEQSCAPPIPCYVATNKGNILDEPGYFTLDTANGLVYVTDSLANSVRAIGLAKHVPYLGAAQFGAYNSAEMYQPVGIAYNPINHWLYVANNGGKYEITSIAKNGSFSQYKNCNAIGFGVVYDPANGYMYVTNKNSGSVSFLS